MCVSAMLHTIEITIILTILSSVEPQRWPKEVSCAPCHCSVQESKYTYGLVKYVNCSHLGLITVPSNLPTDLDFLDLSYNNIDIRTIESVCDFESLQFLSLAFNFFTSLDGSPFSKCSLLAKLDLTGSSIFQLRNASFAGLDNLQTIYGLEAESVEEGVFEKMHKLKTLEFLFLGDAIPEQIFAGLPVERLNLTLSMVVKIPVGLFEFGEKTLQSLCLNGPKVTFIYENLFRGLTVLRKVDIHMPQLVSLPERLFSNFGVVLNGDGDPRNLQEINLMSMSTVPKTIFKDLESLQRLEIHEVHEIAISGLFDDLVNLEVLDLTNSSVVEIPSEWFSKLYSLKTLNLSNCNLRAIDDRSLIGLMNLKTLDLSMNALRTVPLKTFDPLRNSIQNLHLGGNILKTIDSQLFRQMLALQYLDLSDNKIANISVDAFSDLKLLNSLQLQENKLLFLPVNLFLQQPNLQILNLGTNSFRRVPLAVQKSAGFLLRLYLPNNRIISIPKTLPADLPYLEYLNLMDNNLRCRCRLLSVRLYKPNLYIDGLCGGPPEFRGRHVMSFDVPDICEGPKPPVEVTSAFPKVHMTSTVPPYLPPGLYDYEGNNSDYYYDNNYYGSEDYVYDTDQYYDLQSEERLSINLTSVTETVERSESVSTDNLKSQDIIKSSESTEVLFTKETIDTNDYYQGSTYFHLSSSEVDLHTSSDTSYNLSSFLPTEPLSKSLILTNATKSSSIITASFSDKSETVNSDESRRPARSLDDCSLSMNTSAKDDGSLQDTSSLAQTTDDERKQTVTTSSSSYPGTQPTEHTKSSADETESITDSLSSNYGAISPTASDSISGDDTAILETPHGQEVETDTTGMSIELKGIVGFLGGGALICICGTLWWLKTQVAKRRMYEVTPSNTVV